MAVTNVAELNALVERVKKAQREYASFTQEQVDKIFRAAALAAADATNTHLRENGRCRIRHGYRRR